MGYALVGLLVAALIAAGTTTLVVLKIMGMIENEWLEVLAPLWISGVFAGSFFCSCLIVSLAMSPVKWVKDVFNRAEE